MVASGDVRSERRNGELQVSLEDIVAASGIPTPEDPETPAR